MIDRLLALCAPAGWLPGLETTIGPLGLPALLFVVGLAGGVAHCAPMCGPFVLAQTATNRLELGRLRGGLLLPYHLGRLVTYGALGAVAGGVADAAWRLAEAKGLAVALLALGAVVFLAQALALLGLIGTGRGGPGAFGRGLAAIAAPLAGRQGPFARFGLGAALGFLPCGLLYGALAVAGGGGTAPAGALAMVAFGLGTVPSLMGVGVGGAFLAAKRPRYLVPLGAAILIADALVLAVLAYGAAVG